MAKSEAPEKRSLKEQLYIAYNTIQPIVGGFLALFIGFFITPAPQNNVTLSDDAITYVTFGGIFLGGITLILNSAWNAYKSGIWIRDLISVLLKSAWDVFEFSLFIATIRAAVLWNQNPSDNRLEPLLVLVGIATVGVEAFRQGALKEFFERVDALTNTPETEQDTNTGSTQVSD